MVSCTLPSFFVCKLERPSFFKLVAVIYLDFWFVTGDGEIDFEEFIRMMKRASYGY